MAPSHGGSRLSGQRHNRFQRGFTTLLIALVCSAVAAACHRDTAPVLKIEWALAPTPPTVGASMLELHIVDGSGRPVSGAHLRVEAHMSHPGMAPVVAAATEREDGRYRAPLEFDMGGDWILVVAGSLANGEAVHYRIDVPNVRAA